MVIVRFEMQLYVYGSLGSQKEKDVNNTRLCIPSTRYVTESICFTYFSKHDVRIFYPNLRVIPNTPSEPSVTKIGPQIEGT